MKKLILLLLLIPLVFSCSSEEPCSNTPKLTTNEPEDITDSSVTITGSIIPPSCDPTIISQGLVISNRELPTKNNTLVLLSSQNISHTFTLLSQNKTYYVRTYFENSLGEFYGPQVSFSTTVGKVILKTGNNIRKLKSNSVTIENNKIESNGGGTILRYGLCWSKNQNPTIEDFKKEISDNSQPLGYRIEIENLEPNTIYYAKAFAENESGYYYGNEISFTTTYGYQDYEGNQYESIHLYYDFYTNLYFITQNLNTKFFANGDEILQVKNHQEAKYATDNKIPAWCYFNFDESNANRGKLYNFYVLNDSRNIGLNQWRLPTDAEMIISFDRVAEHFNPQYDKWGGTNADRLKVEGITEDILNIRVGFDAFATNSHNSGMVNDGNFFSMWTSSSYKDPRYTEPYRIYRALNFDGSNSHRTLRGKIMADRTFYSIRLVYKSQ